jgi:DNA-binding transcriptional LysR family regulator
MERNALLGVELRHLAALEAVARTRSFGKAARDLGYTQSAVSQQIAQLERSVGQRLVERPGGPRPVDLTDAGRLLLRHADAIVAQLDAAQADMAALAEGAAGPLRVGIYQSVGARILPALLRRFREEYPRVEVSIREETDAADLLRLLEHGELDLTFADLPLPEGPFETEEVLSDPYVLLVPAKS